MGTRDRYQFREEAATFKSAPQNARALTEAWAEGFLFCPDCTSEKLRSLPNNAPVADFECSQCGHQYELKSSKSAFKRKVVDGAYSTMIERLTCNTNPSLFLLRYSADDWQALDVTVIPRFFFTPRAIEKRNPLSQTAKRAGWTGCNILLDAIPNVGKIPILEAQIETARADVYERWHEAKTISSDRLETRGWLMLTLRIVEQMPSSEFTLSDIYAHEHEARALFPNNNNVRAKLRQQLQFLRDRHYLAFLGQGRYKSLLPRDR